MSMCKWVVASLMAALSLSVSAQQQIAANTEPQKLAGVWKGTWNSNTSPATGDLTIQVTEANGDLIKGTLAMTRPTANGFDTCVMTPIPFEGKVNAATGEVVDVVVDFKGKCNKNTFKFAMKGGKLLGDYKTASGSHGGYALNPEQVVAVVNPG